MCREYDAWRVVVDRRWTHIGVAKAMDGRWVVEFVAAELCDCHA